MFQNVLEMVAQTTETCNTERRSPSLSIVFRPGRLGPNFAARREGTHRNPNAATSAQLSSHFDVGGGAPDKRHPTWIYTRSIANQCLQTVMTEKQRKREKVMEMIRSGRGENDFVFFAARWQQPSLGRSHFAAHTQHRLEVAFEMLLITQREQAPALCCDVLHYTA